VSAGPSSRRAPAVAPADLLARAREGHAAATGRLLSFVERGGAQAREVARVAVPHTGGCFTVGITGAPGAGKSTLTGRLVGALRGRAARVAVLAIDPSSPFSGGAVLGDRIRMQQHALDGGVLIRSMATRGHLGGLSLAVPEAVRLLDAVGYDWVVIETVGVGQVEVEVAGIADTTVVVVNPGWGDDVQAAKAGLLEVADVFVVNKADRPGANQTALELEHMLTTSRTERGWRPPVVATVASEDVGSQELLDVLWRHRTWLEGDGRLSAERTRRLWTEVEAIVAERLRQRARARLEEPHAALVRSLVGARVLDPWSAADRLLAAMP